MTHGSGSSLSVTVCISVTDPEKRSRKKFGGFVVVMVPSEVMLSPTTPSTWLGLKVEATQKSLRSCHSQRWSIRIYTIDRAYLIMPTTESTIWAQCPMRDVSLRKNCSIIHSMHARRHDYPDAKGACRRNTLAP